jgi:peptide/nickel transport system permease protein
LGAFAAYRQHSRWDVLATGGTSVGISVPVFVLGLVLQLLFAVVLKDTPFALPPSGRLSAGVSVVPLAEQWNLETATGPLRSSVDFISNMYTVNAVLTLNWALLADAARHLALPVLTLGTLHLAVIARMTRSGVSEVLASEYVRTARAKGLGEWRVVQRHAMPNALLPLVTVVGIELAALFGGAVLTETIFGVTGVGLTLYQAITARDYVVIQTFAFVIAVAFLLINLVVDISYAHFDPRIRLQ